MTDTDTVERVASAMWESRGNASTWDDAENTALVSIYRNLARAAIAALPPAVPEHSDDFAVRKFSEMMAKKMKTSREKGRNGWDDPERCSVEYLRELLNEHVAKGDPVDVANICMMLHHYKASTAPTTLDPVAEAAKVLADWFDDAITRDYVGVKGSTRSLHSDTLLIWLRALTKDGEAG